MNDPFENPLKKLKREAELLEETMNSIPAQNFEPPELSGPDILITDFRAPLVENVESNKYPLGWRVH